MVIVEVWAALLGWESWVSGRVVGIFVGAIHVNLGIAYSMGKG